MREGLEHDMELPPLRSIFVCDMRSSQEYHARESIDKFPVMRLVISLIKDTYGLLKSATTSLFERRLATWQLSFTLFSRIPPRPWLKNIIGRFRNYSTNERFNPISELFRDKKTSPAGILSSSCSRSMSPR